MRYTKTFLSLALIAMLTSSASAQLADGECTVFLDPAQFEDLVIDEIGLDDVADFAIAAPLMTTSPIADGVLTPGEYANACFFTYAENENPGQSWPNYDNLDDGDADLTTTLHSRTPKMPCSLPLMSPTISWTWTKVRFVWQRWCRAFHQSGLRHGRRMGSR